MLPAMISRYAASKSCPTKLHTQKWKRLIPILALPIAILSITISTSFHRLGSIHKSMKDRDAHAFAIPATRTATNITTDVHSSSEAVLDTVPPKSIGACHNLTWWTATGIHLRGDSTNLQGPPPVPANASVANTVWVASFPGSGAEMFRTLIEALTGGLPAWSVYVKDNPIPNTTCLEARAATCKTHWPVLAFRPVVFPPQGEEHDSTETATTATTITAAAAAAAATTTTRTTTTDHHGYHSQAIVLLRNPVSAYPSRFNHQWELKHNVGYHVRQAPEKAWNNFIRRTFRDQQEAYFQFVTTWANLTLASSSAVKGEGGLSGTNGNDEKHHPADADAIANANTNRVALFVPYEGLIDPVEGPMWTRKIIRVLHQAGTRHVAYDGRESKLELEFEFSGRRHHNNNNNNNDNNIKNNNNNNDNDNDNDGIACLWKDAIFDRPSRKRAPHTYTPGYTRNQQEQLQQMVRDLLDGIRDVFGATSNNNNHYNNAGTTRNQRDLLSILDTYQKSVPTNEE